MLRLHVFVFKTCESVFIFTVFPTWIIISGRYRYILHSNFIIFECIDQLTIWISAYIHPGNFPVDAELGEILSCIDSALDQAFFYLYGLKINLDSCSEDDLVVHKNTRPGDYQMKEQCADVFQYVLPYAKALSVSKHLMKTLLFVTFDYTLWNIIYSS
jgi:hypothetical protein